jgi:GT2 family glycosyltransferase
MKLHIAITTYNRPDGLEKLLQGIQKEQGDHEIKIFLYDDCSPKPYQELQHQFDLDIQWFTFPKNNGKQGYWRVVDRVLQDASQCEFDYFFLLQDDGILVPNFFDEAIRKWNGILDRKKATLCTFTPKTVYNRVMWGGRAKDVTFRGETFIDGGYVDCEFMCPRETLNRLAFQIRPVHLDWKRHPNMSSGVGMQMTQRLNDLSMKMYVCRYSLIDKDLKIKSEMNKEEREKNPLIPMIQGKEEPRTGTSESIFVGMASIPSRQDALYNALKSLTRQVNTIYVSLNGYTEKPPYWAEFDNVEWIMSTNDMGDANKFLKVGSVQGYWFSCDDDIVYPDDYVKKMIDKIKKYDMRVIVTCHARTVNKRQIKNYYSDTQQHHFALRQHMDIQSDIPGTGVCAFHTDHVGFSYDNLHHPNMADIWLGVWAKSNNVPVICIERTRRWLKDIKTEETIYRSARGNDSKQVEVMNSISWK